MERESFDPDEFERVLSEVAWVREVHAVPELVSTNDEASALGRAGAPQGTVVVADRQTGGRGRLGRRWVAEPGTALLASWVMRPSFGIEQWPLLGLIAGVAAAQAVERSSGVRARLKWPNDVMIEGRKLAGILAEGIPCGIVVIGLGLNVRQSSFPEDLGVQATSLLLERGRPVGRAALLAAILEMFSALVSDMPAGLQVYREMCDTIGHRVRVERGRGEPLLALATDVSERGELIVATETGRVVIATGEVVHVR